MKKLFAIMMLFLSAMGGGCSNSKDIDSKSIIDIPEESLKVTVSAETNSAQTIGFETKQAWQASVGESRSDNWITISPTSGPAGKNNISVTLTSNTSENSRTAVITIISGSDSVEITVTQRGTGDSEDPEDPENPTHPEVTPENRLTLIEQTYSDTYDNGGSVDTKETKSFFVLKYDAQGQLASAASNEMAEDYPDMLDGTNNVTINWGAEKITMDYKDFHITTFSNSDGGINYEPLPYGRRNEYKEEYLRNKDGLVTSYTDPDGDKTEYIYNADKTLKSKKWVGKNSTETTTYTWENGNMTNMVNTYGSNTSETTFTYTEYPNPWQGVDMAALCTEATDDFTMLLGIGGLSTKNLPATKQDRYGTTRFEYTFDAQGRLSTAVSTYTTTPSSSNRGHGEYKFHYGEVTVPSYPVKPYVKKQEVAEQGTLNYSFNNENPDEHFALANAYTSFVKIHSTLTDGTTRDQTIYAQIQIPDPMPEGGSWLPNLALEQQQVDNFRLTGHSLTEDYLDENIVNPHPFTCTLNYNCFSVDMKCEVYYPDYNIYSATTGNVERRTMPMRPFTKECIIVHQPEIQVISEEEGIYEFTQKFAVQINPSTEPAHTNEIRRTLTTKTR